MHSLKALGLSEGNGCAMYDQPSTAKVLERITKEKRVRMMKEQWAKAQ